MNSPESPERNLQAGEYVLGTLDSDEIAQINRQLEYDAELRAEVVEWQEKLQPLADAIEPVTPSDLVWKRLTGQLQFTASQSRESLARIESDRRHRHQRRRDKLIAWQWIGSLALAATTILGIALWQTVRTPTISPFDVVGVVNSTDNSNALWVINASFKTQTVQVTAISPPQVNDDQDHQLWLVKPDNNGVTSLGVLPRNANITQITNAPQLQENAVAFAVSLEPLGGSPESVPTGPVLYQAAFNKIAQSSR